ncbi:MAG: DNA recombination protein RmuC [Lachnospira sp.]|nr:DNA recombination protein RmuC [Lachnospira sp.]
MYENNNHMLIEQLSRQSDSTVNQVDRMITKIKDEMNSLRYENQENFNKINSIITEKMQSILDEKLNNVSQTVVKNMAELSKNLNESQEKQEKSTIDSLERLRMSFENIRKEINFTLKDMQSSNSENMDKLRRENQESFDKINSTVNEKLQKTLDDKISKSFETVNQRLKEVYEGLGEMKLVASGVTDLKNVLSNVKARGILGEIQLGAILEEILAPEQYSEQVQINPNSIVRVDFAVKLPGYNDKGIWLPIDSKFPGDTYTALQKAYESSDKNMIDKARKELSAAIRHCAKSINEKYIQVPYTTNFAIMFLPFEGLYAEVVNMGLIEDLQHNYKINIAGPSTMAAMLNALRMGFATLAIQKKSGEVWEILKAAKTEFGKFEEGLINIQKRLRTTDSDLDKLIGMRTRAINRKLDAVEKIDNEQAESILELK